MAVEYFISVYDVYYVSKYFSVNFNIISSVTRILAIRTFSEKKYAVHVSWNTRGPIYFREAALCLAMTHRARTHLVVQQPILMLK